MPNDHSQPPDTPGKVNAPRLDDALVTRVAERVGLLLQLDRTRHHVPTQVDVRALGNLPASIASVFAKDDAIDPRLEPARVCEQINRRIAERQAQIYLLRLELDNRFERDPARLFEDPLAISAYGERMETIIRKPRAFTVEPSPMPRGGTLRRLRGPASGDGCGRPRLRSCAFRIRGRSIS